MTIRAFHPADESAVIDLWMRCGLVAPQNNPRADIQRKLQVAPELFLVGTLDEEIVATVMAGYEGHRGWTPLRCHDDGVLFWLRFDDEPGLTEAPILAARPARPLAAVIRLEAACDPREGGVAAGY